MALLNFPLFRDITSRPLGRILLMNALNPLNSASAKRNPFLGRKQYLWSVFELSHITNEIKIIITFIFTNVSMENPSNKDTNRS